MASIKIEFIVGLENMDLVADVALLVVYNCRYIAAYFVALV